MQPKFLLIVIAPRGVIIRDTPRPQSEGGIQLRTVAVGKSLDCYDIHNIGGVPYGRLVPQKPGTTEWLRIKEADGTQPLVDVIELEDSETDSSLAKAITLLAKALMRE